MTERDAFILGVSSFCKQAGMDADDTWEMTRLLLMEPFRAVPIIKRAAKKTAGLFGDGNFWADIGALGGLTQGNWFWAGDAPDRNKVHNLLTRQQAIQRQEMEAIKRQKEKGEKMVGITDPDQINKTRAIGQTASTEGWKGTALGRAGEDAPALASAPTNIGGKPDPAAVQEKDKKPQTQEEALAAAMKGTAAEAAGYTPEMTTELAGIMSKRTAHRNVARMLQRQGRVSDPRYIKGINWQDPKYEGLRTYLERTRGQLPGTPARSAVPASTPGTPAGQTTEQSAVQQQAATALSRRGNRAPQTTSSPPVDMPAGQSNVRAPAQEVAADMTAVPSRGSMSHLMGSVPGVTPGTPTNNTAGGAPAGTSTGGSPPATQTAAQQNQRQTPADMASYGSGASDNEFANHPNVQQMVRETQRYKQMGGTGSVQVGLPSRAGTLSV